MTRNDPVPGRRARALQVRATEVEDALGRGGDRLPTDDVSRVREALGTVRSRLALGVDHTVVALVGGTGSGKSSLFNAVSGLRLADVGARRPTTSRVTACAWSHEAGALMDWLGVDRDRRMERESELDGESQADLRGLVLLDLPDHDSIAPEHREVVDRLLPMVDLLVWVVDPQKYADDALHTGYLRHLVGHEQSMVVVLNQVDAVPPGARAELLEDVRRLLVQDGLVDVPVHGVSAVDGTGLPDLRASLARAVAGRGAAATRARAELDTAVRTLRPHVGDLDPDLVVPTDHAVQALLRASGAPAVADLLAQGAPARALEAPEPAEVQEVLQEWAGAVVEGLPGPWAASVESALPGAASVQAAVATAAARVPLPPADTRHPVLARLADGLARGAARRRDQEAAARFSEAVRGAVRAVVVDLVERPVQRVLDDHAAVREVVDGVGDGGARSTDRRPTAASTGTGDHATA